MLEIKQQIKDARRAGVPLIMITTADPAQTIKTTCAALNGDMDKFAIMQQDVSRGLKGVRGSARGGTLASEIANQDNGFLANPFECLQTLHDCAIASSAQWKDVIVFMHNAHKYITELQPLQAVWNLRDTYKVLKSTVILLCADGALPPELRQDVIVINDPLPNPEELLAVAAAVVKGAQKSGCKLKPEEVMANDKLGDTLTGTSAFGAEQVFSMSLRVDRIEEEVLTDRRRKLVEQTQGLSLWEGGETFEQLGGLDNLKQFLTALLTSGKTPVRAIGFLDEIEKMLAGSGTDTSGTSQDQLMVFLREMQDNNIPGIILLGVGGTGKSAIAKASGRIADAPVLNFDLGAAKGSLVGQSEERIRAMMQVFQAVSQGKGMFIATCNQISALPPELRRRFKLGTFFVDLPTEEERKKIWAIWTKRYELKKQPLPDSTDWTGAEIAACCEVAYRLGCKLKDAADFIVPISKSAPDKVEGLRRMASGKFLSASKRGFYQHVPAEDRLADQGRAISVD